jgi:hypothetical protein
MNLQSLSDQRLIDELFELVSQEREMLTVIIRYLAELERRKLAVTLAYPSSFEFCVKRLGYSESEASARIRVARLVRELPETIEALEDGRLSLSVATRAQLCLQREKNVSLERKTAIVHELYGKKLRETDRILATHFPNQPTPERKTPMDAENTKLEYTIDKQTRLDMERLFEVRSHTNPAKRLDKLFSDLCKLGLKHWDPLLRKTKNPKARASGSS